MRYRSKVVEIEAWQYQGGPLLKGDPDWVAEGTEPVVINGLVGPSADGLIVHTLEGPLRARAGDWIIRGTEGEVYPCKPSVFERKYEPA